MYDDYGSAGDGDSSADSSWEPGPADSPAPDADASHGEFHAAHAFDDSPAAALDDAPPAEDAADAFSSLDAGEAPAFEDGPADALDEAYAAVEDAPAEMIAPAAEPEITLTDEEAAEPVAYSDAAPEADAVLPVSDDAPANDDMPLDLLPFEDVLPFETASDEPIPLEPLPFDPLPVAAAAVVVAASRRQPDPEPAPSLPPMEDIRPVRREPLHVETDDGSEPVTEDAPHHAPMDLAPQRQPDEAFEALTISQALGRLRTSPGATFASLWAVMRTPRHDPTPVLRPVPSMAGAAALPHPAAPRRRPMAQPRTRPASVPVGPDTYYLPVDEPQESRLREGALLVGRGGAFVLALFGCLQMIAPTIRSDADGINAGLGWMLLGLTIWLIVELVHLLVPGADGRGRLFQRPVVPALPRVRLSNAGLIQRGIFMALAVVLGLISVAANSNNRFTIFGIVAWFASITFIFVALTPAGWTLTGCVRAIGRALRPRLTWPLLVVVGLMITAAVLRLWEFRAVPSEMSSDHVEFLLDAARVRQWQFDVFFANNGGREAMQFYLLAALSNLPGLGVNFDTVKLLGVIEGVLTIPLIYWMARELVGREQKTLSTVVGLAAAALVTVSMWHLTLSRQGERIILTPMFMALFLLYFARALRYGRRVDFLYTGLALGFGLYTYQAFRMVPLVVIAGGVIALVFQLRGDRQIRRLILNFVALVLVAFVVFLPLFGYSLQYPDDFWRRTSGRLFGDELITYVNEAGQTVTRVPTQAEQWAAFNENVAQFFTNMQAALFSFNLRGDVAWFNNPPNEPFFDPVSGGLLVVGVSAWIVLMLRRRDPVIWLLPPAFIIMILPSALALAFPIENPSATRMSGALPLVYTVAGLSFGVLLVGVARLIRGVPGWGAAGLAAVAIVAASWNGNTSRYFDYYVQAYRESSLAYSDAGQTLRSFAETVGGWGNAFVINYPYWWDHRAVALEAGRPDWPNGIAALSDTPQFIADALSRGDSYRLDPTRDLLFFYNGQDAVTQDWLRMMFPAGTWVEMPTSDPTESYRIFTAPAPGEDGIQRFLEQALAPAANGD